MSAVADRYFTTLIERIEQVRDTRADSDQPVSYPQASK